MSEKWDRRFLKLAEEIASFSKDPSTQVGAVITKGKEIISTGYNGFSQYDSDEGYNNRELKYAKIIHAEINSILFAKRDLHGMTLYTYPFLPCSNCASIVSQVGILRVISYKNTDPRWEESINLGKQTILRNALIIEYHAVEDRDSD